MIGGEESHMPTPPSIPSYPTEGPGLSYSDLNTADRTWCGFLIPKPTPDPLRTPKADDADRAARDAEYVKFLARNEA